MSTALKVVSTSHDKPSGSSIFEMTRPDQTDVKLRLGVNKFGYLWWLKQNRNGWSWDSPAPERWDAYHDFIDRGGKVHGSLCGGGIVITGWTEPPD